MKSDKGKEVLIDEAIPRLFGSINSLLIVDNTVNEHVREQNSSERAKSKASVSVEKLPSKSISQSSNDFNPKLIDTIKNTTTELTRIGFGLGLQYLFAEKIFSYRQK